jgi:hypothetical protein
MKRILYLSISILPLFLIGTDAKAAAEVAQCGLVGIVDGAGGYQGGDVNTPPTDPTMSGNFLGFGDTAIGYGCASWMAQVDGAFYYDSFSNNGAGVLNGQDSQGHVGGAIFWRDPSVGRFGLAGSEILNNGHFSNAGLSADIGGSLSRIGAFGDFYASDAITLGAGAFYVTGSPFNTTGLSFSESGFEGNIHAKFYATPNLSLGLQGDIQQTNLQQGNTTTPWNGIAGSAEAEFLVPNTALSVFLGGRFASRNLVQTAALTVNDTQGYIGVKWAFGGPVSSLSARDRSGTYDNTSVFDEKLPGLFYDFENANSH